MTTKKNPAFEFLMSALKRNPKSTYADLAEKAKAKKLKVFPIMFGRAKALLGQVKVAPRSKGKQQKAELKSQIKKVESLKEKIASVAAENVVNAGWLRRDPVDQDEPFSGFREKTETEILRVQVSDLRCRLATAHRTIACLLDEMK